MTIKSLSALTSKLSSALSPAFQLNSASAQLKLNSTALSSLLNPEKISSTLSNLFSAASAPKSSAIDLSSLTNSLPKIMDLMQSILANQTSSSNSNTLNTLMQALQPLLHSLSGTGSAQQGELLQALPAVVNSVQTLISSFNGQSNLPDNLSSALTAIKPLLNVLSSAATNTDAAQIISTLNQVLEHAQPLIQAAGSIAAGHADLGDIAQGAAQALMPLLASIDTGTANIDMAKLQQALPAVIGSVTTLIATLTQANQGNIPETISGVIKGINPLLKILENSGALDSTQADTVHKVYDVLNSVKTVLDFVNDPSLLTLSKDLNQVIDSLKPVIAMIDQKGDFSALLDHIEIPDLSGLLTGAYKPELLAGSTKSALGDLLNGTENHLPNISDLFQNTSSLGTINLSDLIPQAPASAAATNTAHTAPQDYTALPNPAVQLDLEQAAHYI